VVYAGAGPPNNDDYVVNAGCRGAEPPKIEEPPPNEGVVAVLQPKRERVVP
jgi:hypothetical protein